MASSSNVDAGPSRNANDLSKRMEVERIMKAFKLNPFDILDLPMTANKADVIRQYRKKSLMIHPDKFKHDDGPEAFDFLKKVNQAEDHLTDLSKRAEIDTIMTHCRTLILKALLGTGYSSSILDTDPRLASIRPPLDTQIRAKAKEVLIEDELAKRRKTKLAYANEGAEKAKQEEEVVNRKRKVEAQAKWEVSVVPGKSYGSSAQILRYAGGLSCGHPRRVSHSTIC
ncbi:MAG: hypothetical protein TREMPRED_003334 [Tremellales sp. Tagirdzhanova-0007]|nr:MAG: hypothetical protein TREMPRED_003334 [Tremellales sp. Tagirdzhanova-0007]